MGIISQIIRAVGNEKSRILTMFSLYLRCGILTSRLSHPADMLIVNKPDWYRAKVSGYYLWPFQADVQAVSDGQTGVIPSGREFKLKCFSNA